MLTEICQYLRNWFERDILLGKFIVSNGAVTYSDGTALPVLTGQYYRIVGSVFNDGVHKTDTLTDEPEFDGAVWLMAVPPDFLALADEIEAWVAKNKEAIDSPYSSESFGGYSYTMRSSYNASEGGSGSGITWQMQFMTRLSPWRKI